MMKILKILDNSFFKNHKFLIIPIFSILATLSLTIFVIIPNVAILKEVGSKEDELKQKNDFYKQKTEILQKIDQTNYKGYINTSLQAMPQDPDVPGALNQILFLLTSNNLQLDGINFGLATETVTPNTSAFHIEVDVSGEATQVKNFIAGTKKIPRLMKVVKLDVSSLGESRIASTITLAVFYQILPQTIGGIDQPISELTEEDLATISNIKSLSKQLPPSQTQPVNLPKGKQDPFN